jgi:hypothetical protein
LGTLVHDAGTRKTCTELTSWTHVIVRAPSHGHERAIIVQGASDACGTPLLMLPAFDASLRRRVAEQLSVGSTDYPGHFLTVSGQLDAMAGAGLRDHVGEVRPRDGHGDG